MPPRSLSRFGTRLRAGVRRWQQHRQALLRRRSLNDWRRRSCVWRARGSDRAGSGCVGLILPWSVLQYHLDGATTCLGLAPNPQDLPNSWVPTYAFIALVPVSADLNVRYKASSPRVGPSSQIGYYRTVEDGVKASCAEKVQFLRLALLREWSDWLSQPANRISPTSKRFSHDRSLKKSSTSHSRFMASGVGCIPVSPTTCGSQTGTADPDVGVAIGER